MEEADDVFGEWDGTFELDPGVTHPDFDNPDADIILVSNESVARPAPLTGPVVGH